jgi:predicted secreted Zn-dependent protease
MKNVYMTLCKQVRRTWLALAVAALLVPTGQVMPAAAIAAVVDAPRKQTTTVTAPVVTASVEAPVTATQPGMAKAAVAPAPKACTPPQYKLPAALALSGRPAGVSHVNDATAYYRVYGDTTAQIETQLRQCPALTRADSTFGAVTGGTLSWQYDWASTSAGTCTISTVRVGLHTNMLLPSWEPISTASTGLAARWDHLITNLAHHEEGHIDLYQQHAQQLVHNLQSLPATDCANIAAQAEATATAIIAAMTAANSTYDVHTHHGVSQGATLR